MRKSLLARIPHTQGGHEPRTAQNTAGSANPSHKLRDRHLAGYLVSLWACATATALLPVLHPAAATPLLATVESHQLAVRIDPADGQLRVEDKLTFSEGAPRLLIGADLKVTAVEQSGLPIPFTVSASEVPGAALLRWIGRVDGVTIRAEGNFAPPADDAQVALEYEAMAINARISPEGAYISPAAGWYASGEESLCRFALTATVPAGWLVVSEGHTVAEESTANETTVQFDAPFRVEGIHICAGPYQRQSTQAGDVRVETYFFAADSSLAPTYLEATAGYIERYSHQFGPYPFKRFAVVENFMPTGYGMPTFTLLGQRVVRLPFIVRTSLGHEVLHNWWGNSVYVDTDSGNWCEGLTSYGADYAYKAEQSPEAARRYRKDLLKAYADYAAAGHDLPLRDFTGRTDMATRAVGYGKAAMVFHMARARIGDQAFQDALRWMAAAFQWKKASWHDFFQAFADVSGEQFDEFEKEWIERPGAPQIDLGETHVRRTNSGAQASWDLAVELRQRSPLYSLQIPLRITLENGETRWERIALREANTWITLRLPQRPQRVDVDPGYDLFRALHPEEMEATLSQFFGAEERRAELKTTVAKSTAAKELAAALAPEREGTTAAGTGKAATARLVISSHLPAGMTLPADAKLSANGTLTLDDHQLAPKTEVAVLALDGAQGPELWIITEDAEQLPPLGRKLNHYGRYSYLVFSSGHNVAKGNWSVTSSPLSREL